MFVEGYILRPWNVLLGFAKSENDFEKRFEVFLLFLLSLLLNQRTNKVRLIRL